MSVAASPPTKPSLPVTAGLALLVAAFAVAAALLWRETPPNDTSHRIAWIVFFVLQVPMIVLVHELGHYGVARALGWRVPIFIWGTLVIRLTPFRVMHSANALGGSQWGAIVAVPPPGREGRISWIAIYAGGPLATLLCGVMAFAVAFAARTNLDGGIAFALFAVLCLIDAAFNLLPFTRGNDGRQIVDFLRGRDVVRSALYARLYEQELNGVRPRDWPAELVEAMRRETLWRDAPEASVNVYIVHFDRGEFEPARRALERASDTAQVLAERAFFIAWIDRDSAAARGELAKAPPHVLQAYGGYWRAAAAVALADKDVAAAREAIRKARIAAAESACTTAFDHEILDALERRLMEPA